MADVKISGLPASTTPLAGTEVLPIVQSGQTKQVSVANLTDGRNVTVGAGTVSAPAVTTTGDTNTGIFFPAADAIAITAGGVEALRAESNGNVGIGSSGDSARLLVLENANLSEADPHLRIQGSGFSGFHWLDGTAYYIGQNSGSRALRMYSSAETAGVNLAAGGTSWGTFSDERLKYDIEPITDGLTKLANVRCVSYRLKDVDAEDSQKKLGVIAQDLVGVINDVIDITKRSDDETEYMSVRYSELIPVLIKAIQELKLELDAEKVKVNQISAYTESIKTSS